MGSDPNLSPEETDGVKTKDLTPDRPGFLSTLQSVAAAAFGVQSGKKREADFRHGNPLAFIAAGVLFTVVFVLTLVLVVRSVLP